MANGNSTATIGFEKQIWAVADILRGSMDAAEYKHVVLELIFLKYFSDKFDERYNAMTPRIYRKARIRFACSCKHRIPNA